MIAALDQRAQVIEHFARKRRLAADLFQKFVELARSIGVVTREPSPRRVARSSRSPSSGWLISCAIAAPIAPTASTRARCARRSRDWEASAIARCVRLLGAALRPRTEQHVSEQYQPRHDFVRPGALLVHAGQRQVLPPPWRCCATAGQERSHARGAQLDGVHAGGRRKVGDDRRVDDAPGDDLVGDPGEVARCRTHSVTTPVFRDPSMRHGQRWESRRAALQRPIRSTSRKVATERSASRNRHRDRRRGTRRGRWTGRRADVRTATASSIRS